MTVSERAVLALPGTAAAGERLEPLEEVVCEVEEANTGEVIEVLTLRKGEVSGYEAGGGGAGARVSSPCNLCLRTSLLHCPHH